MAIRYNGELTTRKSDLHDPVVAKRMNAAFLLDFFSSWSSWYELVCLDMLSKYSEVANVCFDYSRNMQTLF